MKNEKLMSALRAGVYKCKHAMLTTILHSPFSILNSDSGFTLIEILVGIALMGIIMSVSMTMFLQAIRNTRQVSMQNELTQNAERLMETLGYEIKRAGCVVYDGSGSYPTLATYAQSNCSGTPLTTFHYCNNNLFRGDCNNSNSSWLNPSYMRFCDCDSCTTSGLNLNPFGNSGNQITKDGGIQVNLTLRPASSGYDKATCISLRDTFVPRN